MNKVFSYEYQDNYVLDIQLKECIGDIVSLLATKGLFY